MKKPKVAIIGAGLAGLTVAHQIGALADVTIFDKSRAPGGRMATRRHDKYSFDHGAQFFIAKTKAFKQFLEAQIVKGVVKNWSAKFVEINNTVVVREKVWDNEFPHYVACPKMTSLCRSLAEDHHVILNTHIKKITPVGTKWQLYDDSCLLSDYFDWIVFAIPPEQIKPLILNTFEHHEYLNQIKMQSCYSLMLGFETPLDLPWQAAFVQHPMISWISVNSSKPMRPVDFSMVVHASNDWADRHLESDLNWVKAQMLKSASEIVGFDLSLADRADIHRWRYANCHSQQGAEYLIDETHKIACCGDWLIKGRIEAAFTSGNMLGQRLQQVLST